MDQVTDILDTRSDRANKCNYLSQMLDPDNVDDRNCSSSEHHLCKMGDLTRKHGQVISRTRQVNNSVRAVCCSRQIDYR